MAAHCIRTALELMQSSPGRGAYIVADLFGYWYATLDLKGKGTLIALIGLDHNGATEITLWRRPKSVLIGRRM